VDAVGDSVRSPERGFGEKRAASDAPADLLLILVGHGDASACAAPDDVLAPAVFGVARRVQLHRCLEQFPAARAEAIHLAHDGGRTQGEFAEMVGAPLGTLKSRARDGVTRLRERVGADL
jgi:DNA-directed RNA polymerase specialized sigma24 family protein